MKIPWKQHALIDVTGRKVPYLLHISCHELILYIVYMDFNRVIVLFADHNPVSNMGKETTRAVSK